jgi:proline iminopeptidase
MASVDIGGLTLAYDERGDPGAPVIVLVMGLGVQMIFWPEAFCDMLAQRGFRVVRFDNRDIGLSTRLDHLGTPRIALEAIKYALHLPVRAPYRIDDRARDTIGVMDALRIERAHLVGCSMGGMIVQNVAAMAPARVQTLTSIMSTTGARNLPQPTPAARRALMEPPAREGDIEGAVRRMVRLFRIIGSKTHPAPESELRELCERHVRRSYHPAGVARQLVAIAASGDRTAVVKRIAAPTLVVHGDEDPLVRPACGLATARAVEEGGGRATFELVKGMGHYMPATLLPQIAELVAAHAR